MSAFHKTDAPFFFGRENFIQQLFKAVQKQPLVTVTGLSGSGKSSVVFAGLVPCLEAEGKWLIDSFSPKSKPIDKLAFALRRQLADEQTQIDKAAEIAAVLRKEPLRFCTYITGILEKHPSHELLLIVDQFEELYTLCGEQERDGFLKILIEAINYGTGLTIVLTIRADFFGRASAYPPLTYALQQSRLELHRMTREQLQQAIEEPLQGTDVSLAHKLTDRLLDDVGDEPGNLALLEFALTQLWKQQSNNLLTHEAYSNIGGVKQAIGKYAEKFYKNLSKPEQKQAKGIFLQLVHPGEGAEDTRRLATRDEVRGYEDNWKLVVKLANARLVATGQDKSTGMETVEVVHEALIREWQSLCNWMEEDDNRPFRTWQDRLRTNARQWQANNQNEAALLRGFLLEEAEKWIKQRPDDLSQAEQKFIQASLAFREREKAEKERQYQEKLQDQAALDAKEKEAQILDQANQTLNEANRTVKKRLLVSSILSLIIITVTSISALQKAREAKEAGQGTKLEQAGVNALRQLPSDQIEALLSAMRAGQELKLLIQDGRPLQNYPATSPVLALQKILDNIHQQNEFASGQKVVKSVSFSPNSKYIATAGKDGTLRLWDLSGQPILKPIQAHDGTIDGVNSVTFSPDSKTIATAGEDSKVKLWDSSGKLLKTLEEKESGIKSVSFSPDSKKIATAGDYGIARIWNVSGKQEATLKGYKEITIRSITFSPDGKRMATAGDDGTVRLWDLSGKQLAQITPHKGKRVFSVRFSPNGQLLATAGEDNIARIWNLSRQEQRKLEGHENWVLFVNFSPDGKRLVTTSDDGTARVWDLLGKEIYKFQGHEGAVLSASFSPDGKYLATAGKDGKTRLWNLSSKQIIQTTQFKGHQNDVNSLSISPDGKLMASGDNDGIVRLWDFSSRKQRGKEFKADNKGRLLSVKFSPDGKFIATGGEEGQAKIWDLSGKLITRLKGNYPWISSLSFSSDGKYIVTSGSGKPPKIWSRDGKEIATLEGHQALVYQVSFHPQKQLIATAAWDGTIGLWIFSGNKINQIKIWRGHQAQIRSLSFSPDGEQIATADDNSNLKVWDLSGNPKLEFFSYQSGVKSIAFSPRGEYIATGGTNRTVKVWDLSGRQVAEFNIEKGSVWDISFSVDGKSLVAGGDNGSLQLSQVKELDELLTEGCDWLKGYLESHKEKREMLKVCRNK